MAISQRQQMIDALVSEVRNRHSSQDLDQLARRLVEGKPDALVLFLAGRYIADLVRTEERAEALSVERDAVRITGLHETAGGGVARQPKRGTKAYREWVRTTEEGRSWENAMIEADRAGDEINRRMMQELRAITDAFAADLRMEWTQELLDTGFALPDGTKVTWGDATIDQHRERVGMFTSNAAANLEGAARHTKAIQELESNAAPTLRLMVLQAA